MKHTELNINQVKTVLRFLLDKSSVPVIPTIIGLSGIGKTAVMRQVALELDYKLIEIDVPDLNEGDLALPVLNNGVVTYHINSQFQEIINHPEIDYLVFLDEANRAQSKHVLNEIMTFTKKLTLYGHKLPPNTRFVKANNPASNMSGFEDTEFSVADSDSAQTNREHLIYMKADLKQWLSAYNKTIHPYIIEFFKEPKHHKFFYYKDNNEDQFSTPRTWVTVSDLLFKKYSSDYNNLKIDSSEFKAILSGALGETVANMFIAHVKELDSPLNIDLVFKSELLSSDFIDMFKKSLRVEQSMFFKKIIQKSVRFTYFDRCVVQNILSLWFQLTPDLKLNFGNEVFKTNKPLFDLFINFNKTGNTSPFYSEWSAITDRVNLIRKG